MSLVNILHMNVGDEETSYANNSFLQETVIRKSLPFLKYAITDMVNYDVFNNCFAVADLGCSSGTNTLLVAFNIFDIVCEACRECNHKVPQFQVCLNDLFGNDFNTIFKSLPDFYVKIKDKGESFGHCFVSAIPGSFYGRLVPDQSLHLVHASTSNHWLSQVPQGLENNGLNIYMAKTSPPNVYQAYAKQFHTDFTKFLQMRSEEVVRGGSMVLTLIGRSEVDPTTEDSCALLELLGQSLVEMLTEGLVREQDMNSFNVPVYFPCIDEVKNIVAYDGSFSLKNFNAFNVNWDPDDMDYTNMNDCYESSLIHGKNISKVIRAVFEPLLSSHFGGCIIDMLFEKFGQHVAEYLTKKKTKYFFITLLLTKK
ncbi:hypothetical protein QVD17_08016 [Tagetes erecta]|uniref:Uncharacterized protein n=1 Tax=Tagetes erecta TaxID=13708 RepID=A0AAD8L2H2_TARER|nr:hypothetical protein QVD17_08016 [Tagetes erecta]